MSHLPHSKRRNLAGNLAILGLFGGAGVEGNNHVMAAHNHMVSLQFMSYVIGEGELDEASAGKSKADVAKIRSTWRKKGWVPGEKRVLEQTTVPDLLHPKGIQVCSLFFPVLLLSSLVDPFS